MSLVFPHMGVSDMFTSNLSWTPMNTSVSSETNVVARILVPNLPALAT